MHTIRQLAIALARDVPRNMTGQVLLAWERRWTRAVAFAAILVEPAKWCDTWSHTGGIAPGVADLLAQDPR